MPGFKREALAPRYDVPSTVEDEWHAYSGRRTAELVAVHVGRPGAHGRRLLNAGAGVYVLGGNGWIEVAVDLFRTPIRGHTLPVCASLECLPLADSVFSAVVCVGEVLSYCEPALVVREFARVLVPGGTLICDFASSRSGRYWFQSHYGRAAALVTHAYNGGPERVWAYDPRYVAALLESYDFDVRRTYATHAWSSILRRFGVSTRYALRVERAMRWTPNPFGDVMTFVAVRT